jgi:hypothetical protein
MQVTKSFTDGDSLCFYGLDASLDDVKEIIDDKIDAILYHTDVSSKNHHGWVERPNGKTNFRRHVAKTWPYKGNRKGKPRPEYLSDAKHYLVDKYNFSWAEGIESEDHMLIAAKAYGVNNCYKCCIDKDCYQQHGWFFDYKTMHKFWVTPEFAHWHLYKQFLTGDKSTDNIPGVNPWNSRKKGITCGDKTAEKVLAAVDPSEYALEVARQYKTRGHNYDYLMEQCQLLYLLRERGEVFEYPISKEEYEVL